MRKIKTENLIAVVALVGICLLFGSFLFSNATGALAVLAAFVAGAGVIVIALLRYVKSRKVILGLAGVCIVCATVISLVTVPANAAFSFVETTMYRNLKVTATTTDNTNSNCEIDVSQIEDGKLTVIAKGYTGLNDCDEPEDKSDTVTITFTNISSLTMTYDLSLANTSGEAAGTGKTLEPGKSITIKVASGGKGPSSSTTGTIEFSNVNFEEQGLLMTTTFETRPGGTFTVDGEEIFENVGKEKSSKELYKLIATADPGYRFYGWMSKLTGTLTSSTEYDFDAVEGSPDTVWPVFVRENAPVFYVKDESPRIYYGDLNEAIKVAQNGSNKVVVPVKDETNNALPAGEYTIPTGVTLLIPFDDANTLYTNKPETDIAYTAPSIHLTLTMASGAHITVANGGAISLSAKQSAKMPYNGAPTGKLSRIDMKDGSSITVQGGGNLYCWGVITGSGSVVMESGSTIYQDFQAIGWRGGSFTSEIKNNSEKVFPMNQYYFQNVQVPLTMESGAVMNCQTAMDITSVGVQTPAFTVVGKDSGLFRINSGSISFDYLEDLDRMHITIDGDVAMSNIVLEMKISILANVSINSANFVLPLMQNMDLTINGTADLMYDVAMLPGTRVEITESGKVNVKNGANLFVYDKDQWGGYCGSGDKTFMPSPWAYGRTKTFSDADLADSVLKVNGVLDASKGYVYTTTSGAEIISDGDGKIILQAGTQSVTYQISQASKNFPEIPITPAKLKNADGNYIQSATNTYEYINGKWHVSGCDAVVKDRVTKQPTCAEPGIKATGCDCGLYDTGAQEIPKTDEHNYNAVVTAPTCMAEGYTTHTCSVCGDSYTDSTVPATGVHTPGETVVENKKDATCTVDGSYDNVVYCTVCNAEQSRETVTDAAKGHTEVTDAAVEATCTATGLTEGKHCSVCNEVLVGQTIVPAKEHAGGAATCTEKAVCNTCGQEYGDVLAHDFENGTWVNPYADVHARKCKNCDAQSDAGLCSGGTATCTSQAVCDACGKTYGTTAQHDYKTEWSSDDNYHWYQCKDCDAVDQDSKAEHVFIEQVEDEYKAQDATCTEPAVYYKSCSVCGKASSSEIFPVGEKDPTKHVNPEDFVYVNKLDGTHAKKYACCDAEEVENHTFEDGVCVFCHARASYTITFVNYDDTVLATITVTRGDLPEYSGDTPVRESDADYHYVFESWGGISIASEDKTYTAQFTAVAHTWDGDCDTDCDDCGYTRTITHAYGAPVFTWVGYECTAKVACSCGAEQNVTVTVTAEITVAATCTTQGTRTYTATVVYNGKTYTADEHPTASVEVNPAAHVENPDKHGYCKLCDALMCKHDGSATHTDAVAATCTTSGNIEYWTCDVCGLLFSNWENKTRVDNVTVNALEHKMGAWETTTPATCTVNGEERRDCSYCDHYETKEIVAPGHTYGELIAAQPEVHTKDELKGAVAAHYICEVCDAYFTEGKEPTTLAALTSEAPEHHYHDATCTAPATCDCGATNGTENGHSFIQAVGSQKEAATCTDAAVHYVKCDNCSEEDESKTVSVGVELGHDYEGVVTTPPTCAAEGVKTYTCKNDASHTYTEAIAKLTTHTEATKEENRVEATCGADGSYDLVTYCSVCGTVIKTEKQTITATGDHVYATETEKVDATCTEDGYVIKACGCGATEKITLNALDHDCEDHEAKAPTCTEIGWDAYQTCSRCDYTTYVEISKKDHTEATKEENRVEATCGVDGSYDLVTYCSVCGEELDREQKTIPATGNHVDSDSNGSCDNCGAAVEVEEFTITFVDYFGETTSVTLKKGEDIPFPKDLESVDSPSFELEFCGWAMAGDTTCVKEATATQNATYTAMFKVTAFKPDSLQLSVEYGATGDVVLYATLFVYVDTHGQLGAPVVLRDKDTVESEFEFVFDTQTIYMYKLAYTADDIANISSFIYIQIGPKDRLYEEKINQVLFKYAASLEHAGAVEGELSENVLKAQQALIDAILRYGGAVQDCFAGDDSDIRTYGRLAATAELWNGFDKEAAYDSVRGDNADSVFATNFLAATCDFNTEIALRYFYTAALNDAETAEIISVGVIVADSVQELESLTGEFVQSEGSTAQLYKGELTQITVNGQSVNCYVSTTAAMTINEMDDKYTVIYVEYADDQGTQYYYGDIIGYGIERFAQRQIRDYSSKDIGGNGKEVSSDQYNTEQYVNLLLRILRVNEAAKALEAEKAKGTN